MSLLRPLKVVIATELVPTPVSHRQAKDLIYDLLLSITNERDGKRCIFTGRLDSSYLMKHKYATLGASCGLSISDIGTIRSG